MISFIVSVFNKPIQLLTCVTSLMVQKEEKEIILCDNTPEGPVKSTIQSYVKNIKEVIYLDTSKECPPDINAGYRAQNIGAKKAKEDWLCFPSEDTYYVPGFSEVMINAAEENGWEFVYCDFLFDPRYNCYASKGTYSVVSAYPRFRFIDKNCYILRRRHFKAFPMEEHGYGDYLLCEELIKRGVKHGHAPGVLVVHN